MALSPSAALSRSSRSTPDQKATLPPASSAPPAGRLLTLWVRWPALPIVWQRREAQGTDIAVRARAVAPSTASQVALIPSRDSKRETVTASQELTAADGVGLRRLPKEILALIAADASDRIESALTLFFTLTDQNDIAAEMSVHARDSKFRTPVEKVMLTHNPYLRFSSLVQDIPEPQITSFTFDGLRAVLREQARAEGFVPDEIEAWLRREETVCQLVEARLALRGSLRNDEWTQAVAERTAETYGDLEFIPPRFISNAMCQRVVSSPAFRWYRLRCVPERHRTPALLDLAVRGDPHSIRAMKPADRTPERLAAAARGMGFERFKRFLISEKMTEDPLCRQLLAQLKPAAEHPARQ